MGAAPIIFLAIIGVTGLIFIIVKLAQAHAERERRRKAGIWAWGQANGFAFYEKDSLDLEGRLQGIADVGKGHSRYAFEILTRNDPVPTFLFRYHFATTETRTVTTTDSNGNTSTRIETYEQDHWRAYLMVELAQSFPSLVIRPEHWGDKLAGFIGFDDIDFESEQFSSRYFVKSSDRQFAYAIVHPQLMEWLLAREFVGEIDKGMLILNLGTATFDADHCHASWMEAAAFVNQIPPFVWQDYGKRQRVELPSSTRIGLDDPRNRSVA